MHTEKGFKKGIPTGTGSTRAKPWGAASIIIFVLNEVSYSVFSIDKLITDTLTITVIYN